MIHELFKMFNWLGSEWVLGLLGVLSVMVVAIVLQRWMQLRKLSSQSGKFWNEVGNQWFSGQGSNWQSNLDELKQSYPSLELDTLELISKQNGGDTGEVVNAYLEHQQMKLEKNVGVLGTIGANAAFIGLLGTVIGIIRAFSDMATQGLGAGVESVTGGIAEALVATAVGLCVAIPAVVFFNLLNRKIATIVKKAHSVSALVLAKSK